MTDKEICDIIELNINIIRNCVLDENQIQEAKNIIAKVILDWTRDFMYPILG